MDNDSYLRYYDLYENYIIKRWLCTMRKTILVIAASTFFTLCSGFSLAHAGNDKENRACDTTVTTTDQHNEDLSQVVLPIEGTINDEGLVFDKETARHNDIKRPKKETKKEPAVAESEDSEKPLAMTMEEYIARKLQLKAVEVQLLSEQNKILDAIRKSLSGIALVQLKKQSERDDAKEEVSKRREMSESVKSSLYI